RLQRLVERRPKYVKAASGRIGEALRVILEPDAFDEAGDEEVRAADEIPQARNREDSDDCRDDQTGTHARRRGGLGDQQDRPDQEDRAPGEPEFELPPKVHASPCAGKARRATGRARWRQATR